MPAGDSEGDAGEVSSDAVGLARRVARERGLQWARLGLMLPLLAGGVYFCAVRPVWAQVFPDPIPVIVERVTGLQKRMDASETMVHAAVVDLAILKDNMLEVKWLGRSVAVAIGGQLLIGWMHRPRRRRASDEDDDSGPIDVRLRRQS